MTKADSRVVNFIQISIVHERTLSQTEPSAQAVGHLIQLLTGTQPGVRYPRSEAYRAKGDVMQLPKIFQGESLTRLIQGAIAGFSNGCHRLRMGGMDARKHGDENGGSKHE